MANKVICDRCGKDCTVNTFANAPKLVLKFGFNVNQSYDLCKDCLNEFREWIRKPDQTEPRCDTCMHREVVSKECDRCDKSTHSRYEPMTDCPWK